MGRVVLELLIKHNIEHVLIKKSKTMWPVPGSSSSERQQTWFCVPIFFALSNACTSGWNYTHYARVSGPHKALSARYARVSGQCSTDDLAVRRNHWIDARVSGPHLKIVPALAGHIEHRVPALAGSVYDDFAFRRNYWIDMPALAGYIEH